ncbi:MAG TPA: sensor histidine kinase N-terminal domain-containing protein [Burkholderiales bacterium]|nr:sensor histidine kinase N-terminal domain-containing protein [Burkholderiales bacterium]
MSVQSLRGQLLRQLLPPVAALLALATVIAYYPTIEPATAAYDQALIDVGLALGDRIQINGGKYSLDLPDAAERVLRTDRYDAIYFHVAAPDGGHIAGDQGLPPPPPDKTPQDHIIAYDGIYAGKDLRIVAVLVPCDGKRCLVQVAETTNKRERLLRYIVLSSLVPTVLIALATLLIVWFGVKRGLEPLDLLSEEIKRRSPRDLRPVQAAAAPEETKPLVNALNALLEEVAQANQNQQRFLANAAHQLRTPLAGLQAHTELALAQPVPEGCRAELEQVHLATVRTARLANQLLALARAEPGGGFAAGLGATDLRQLVQGAADEWVHRAMERDLDLGFDLAEARVRGDAFLLREALANLVHNSLEHTPPGGHVTVHTTVRAEDRRPILEVEDDGPGIPPAERERVLERFYRIPGTTGTGSGLGLAIVREIAGLHGAEVEIGTPRAGGRGCRVSLIFPPAPQP